MDVYFSTFYTEPGMNFDLACDFHFWKKLGRAFTAAQRPIAGISARFKTDCYDLTVTITTKPLPALDVRGPIWRRKANDVEFVFWIPYIEFSVAHAQLEYVLGQIKAGIIFIFQKYQEDTSRIDEFFAEFLNDTINHPADYK